MGGTSAEREISLSTGRQILAALDREKYIPMAIDSARLLGAPSVDLPAGVPRLSLPGVDQGMELVPIGLQDMTGAEGSMRPDVVFIALHGPGGEDGTIQ